jgi:hypothetical protein
VARQGYYGGDPDAVRRARVDDVMAILEYEEFLSDFEDAFAELNKEP